MIPTIVYRNTTYRLVFHDLLRSHTPAERCGLEDSIAKNGGIQVPILVYDSTRHGPNCVIDGANRLTIGAAKKLTVPIIHAGQLTDLQARALALSLNVDRRHLSAEEQQAARAERIERVVEARQSGESLRKIADDEGISVAQTRRDLQEGGGVPPGAPDSDKDDTPSERPTNGRAKPSWFTGGNHSDPDHPFADVLQAFSNLSRVITLALNRPGGEKLQAYLSHPKVRLVVFGPVVWEGGERKDKAPKFRGFPGLRRLVRLAGKGGKTRTEAQVWAEYARKEEEDE